MIHDHPGMIQKRTEVRQAHLSVVGQNQAVRAGGQWTQKLKLINDVGAFFSKDPTPEDPMPFAVHLHLCNCGWYSGECDYYGSWVKRGVSQGFEGGHLLQKWSVGCRWSPSHANEIRIR